MDPGKRLLRAKVQLLLAHPFFGTLASHLEMEPNTKWLKRPGTFSTDCNKFYYRPDYIEKLNDGQLEFILAHSLLHCALEHFYRYHGRIKKRWDIATDFAVNNILMEAGFPSPDSILYDPSVKDITADSIYGRLPKIIRGSTIDMHLGGPKDPDIPMDETPPDIDKSRKKDWKVMVAQAANTARKQGKLPGNLARFIDDFLEPQLPWRQLLAEYIHSTARDDYRMIPPNKRYIHKGIYLPSLKGEQLEIAVAVDTSGSIAQEDIREFVSELSGIMVSVPDYRIHIFAADSKIQGYQEITPFDEIDKDIFKGGGGTDFRPVFQEIEDMGLQPAALVYLTDGDGEFPEMEPPYPVLWLLRGEKDVPFGIKYRFQAGES